MRFLPIQTRVVRNLRRKGVKVYSRRQWGSRYGRVYAARLISRRVTRKQADTFVAHITVTPDSGKLKNDFFEDMRTVERIGYERFGSGFSYNFGIGQQGELGMGMPLFAKGTHTVNDKNVPGFSYDQNAVARAAAYIAMPGAPFTSAAENTLTLLLQALIEERALTRGFDFKPHSFFAAKDCPTDAVRNKMPEIYRKVQANLRKA